MYAKRHVPKGEDGPLNEPNYHGVFLGYGHDNSTFLVGRWETHGRARGGVRSTEAIAHFGDPRSPRKIIRTISKRYIRKWGYRMLLARRREPWRRHHSADLRNERSSLKATRSGDNQYPASFVGNSPNNLMS